MLVASASPPAAKAQVAHVARFEQGSELPGFARVATGPNGGVVLRGIFPDRRAPQPLRPGVIYLPPGLDGARRYPVVYLLHGMPGGPDEYSDALHIATLADRLIATGATAPFIAVAPAAGPDGHYDGEWAGPWELYVRDIVRWVDAHLPTIPSAGGRTIAGLSAGGYGAADIGLRSPGLFGRIESWSGYFTPLHDGPFKEATRAVLAANDPSRLVREEQPLLRRLGTRFYTGSGPTHSHWFKQQATIDFGRLLRTLGLPVRLQLVPTLKGEWQVQLEAGLKWAFGRR